jgi:hypothetical protein
VGAASESWGIGGRTFGAAELEQVRAAVAWLPKLARRELAETLCEHLEWFTAAGTPKRDACLKLLGRMEQAGLVTLPAWRPALGGGIRREAVAEQETGVAVNPQHGPLAAAMPVILEPVTARAAVREWNATVERHHPLGYRGAFGFRLRYFIQGRDGCLGCILMSGAAKAIAARDQWIGWDAATRLNHLARVVNNSRFLLFSEVRIPHLASHVLGQLARRVGDDWETHWGFRPLLLETFVDPARFRGTCYRAAGWHCLGTTRGRGLARPGRAYRSTPRLIFVKPLAADFRRGLGVIPSTPEDAP